MGRTQTVSLLLVPEDEEAISRVVQDKYPGVKFLDYGGWVDPDVPPVAASISSCGRRVSIWPSSIYPVLPTTRRGDGKLLGPLVGPVVSWQRSWEDPAFRKPGDEAPVLQYGRWDASFGASEQQEMTQFVDGIWRILKKATSNKLLRVPPRRQDENPWVPERQIWVGSRAMDMAIRGELILNADALRLIPESSI
jgi:hypothetical protein